MGCHFLLQVFALKYLNGMKRHLLLGRKVMTNLDSMLKSRNISLLTKVGIVKAVVFPVVTYRCKSWTKIKLSTEELIISNCGAEEKTLERPMDCRDQTSQSLRKSTLNIRWKD